MDGFIVVFLSIIPPGRNVAFENHDLKTSKPKLSARMLDINLQVTTERLFNWYLYHIAILIWCARSCRWLLVCILVWYFYRCRVSAALLSHHKLSYQLSFSVKIFAGRHFMFSRWSMPLFDFFPRSVFLHLINPFMDFSWTWCNLRFLCSGWYMAALKTSAFHLMSAV